jgi:hypothetical protein
MAQVVAFPARAPAATGEVISLREAKKAMRRHARMARAVDAVVRDTIRRLGGLSWDEPSDRAAFHELLGERLLREHPALFAGDIKLSIEVGT